MRPLRTAALAAVLTLSMLPGAQAAVKTQTVAYRDGNVPLRGYLAWDDAFSGPRPGVLVVPEWWGLNDYAKSRARMLAKLGYVALAADMYGEGRVTTDPAQARQWSKAITADVARWRQRALKGLEVLRREAHVDAQHLAAIGYCFGGSTVTELAYAGTDLSGVASFHGTLPLPPAGQPLTIKAKMLLLHGSADSATTPEHVIAFEQALDKAGADWEMVIYGGARHAFTNPDADRYGIPNVRYDAEADRRSWQRLQQFLQELFGRETDFAVR